MYIVDSMDRERFPEVGLPANLRLSVSLTRTLSLSLTRTLSLSLSRTLSLSLSLSLTLTPGACHPGGPGPAQAAADPRRDDACPRAR